MLLQSSWRDRITNEEVFQKVGKNTECRSIRYRRKRLVGHIVRHEGLIQSGTEGTGRRKGIQGETTLADHVRREL